MAELRMRCVHQVNTEVIMPRNQRVEEDELEWAFWVRADRQNLDGCWNWCGTILRDGYGRFATYNRLYRAHRFAYESYYGAVPEGLLVCHHCDNRLCCNPLHLYAGTAKQNADDRNRRGRANTARGRQKKNAVLTTDAVHLIRLNLLGLTSKEQARIYHVSPRHIRAIRSRQEWRYV